MPPAATSSITSNTVATRLPSLYVPHGGGPCFFMDDPDGTWTGMGQFLGELPASLPMQPRAILVVSGHWETPGFMLTANPKPSLLFDYYGFPPHTYQLRYDAPGAPELAQRAAQLLRDAGYSAGLDAQRGLDHGVFVPLKVIYPQAQLPVVELSLDRSLDASLQLAVGRALAPLRDEGVLLLCAGMSFHNLRAFGDARFCHPRPEHLLPLMVAAGASGSPGQRIFNEQVLGTMISGFAFA